MIHPGALGDVHQAVPALAALRETDRLTFAGQPRLGRLLRETGVVDAALAFDGLGLEGLFAGGEIPAEVRSRLGHFDRIVSWFGSRDPRFAARLDSIVSETLLAPPVPETGPPPTVWGHLLASLEPWGVKAPTRLSPLTLPDAWRDEVRQELSRLGWQRGRPLLFVHPGPQCLEEVARRVAREAGC